MLWDYAQDQQCSMPVDAVLSFPERHICDSHLCFTLPRSVFWFWEGVWEGKQNMRHSLPAKRLRWKPHQLSLTTATVKVFLFLQYKISPPPPADVLLNRSVRPPPLIQFYYLHSSTTFKSLMVNSLFLPPTHTARCS